MIKTGFARRSLITGMIALVLVLAAFLMLSASAGAEAYREHYSFPVYGEYLYPQQRTG